MWDLRRIFPPKTVEPSIYGSNVFPSLADLQIQRARENVPRRAEAGSFYPPSSLRHAGTRPLPLLPRPLLRHFRQGTQDAGQDMRAIKIHGAPRHAGAVQRVETSTVSSQRAQVTGGRGEEGTSASKDSLRPQRKMEGKRLHLYRRGANGICRGDEDETSMRKIFALA